MPLYRFFGAGARRVSNEFSILYHTSINFAKKKRFALGANRWYYLYYLLMEACAALKKAGYWTARAPNSWASYDASKPSAR